MLRQKQPATGWVLSQRTYTTLTCRSTKRYNQEGDLSERDVKIVKDLNELLDDDAEWMKECRIWMYRGAWAEWEIDHIEMAVPMSPEQLRFKRNTILKHQSQMENAPFLGDDDRLFWQRAEDRNRATAQLYSSLGLASYEAMEAFVEYHPIR